MIVCLKLIKIKIIVVIVALLKLEVQSQCAGCVPCTDCVYCETTDYLNSGWIGNAAGISFNQCNPDATRTLVGIYWGSYNNDYGGFPRKTLTTLSFEFDDNTKQEALVTSESGLWGSTLNEWTGHIDLTGVTITDIKITYWDDANDVIVNMHYSEDGGANWVEVGYGESAWSTQSQVYVSNIGKITGFQALTGNAFDGFNLFYTSCFDFSSPATSITIPMGET